MSHADFHAILSHLQRDPVVAFVTDTKTEEIGPGIFRFKAEVAWNGDKLVERYLERCGRGRVEAALRHALSPMTHPALLDGVMKSYGRDIINAVGAEVDRIEAEIQAINPGCRYVDLETDRGRFSADPVLRSAFASMSNGNSDGSSHPSLGKSEGMESSDEAGPSKAGAGESRNTSSRSVVAAAAAGLGGIAGVVAPKVVQLHQRGNGAAQGCEMLAGSSGMQESSSSSSSCSSTTLAGEQQQQQQQQQQQTPAGALERTVHSGFADAVSERARSSRDGTSSSQGQRGAQTFWVSGQMQQEAAGQQQQQQQGQGVFWDKQTAVVEKRLAAWDNSPYASSFGEEDYKEVYLESGEVGSTLDGSSFGHGVDPTQGVSAFVADYPCSLCDIPLENLELEDQLLRQEQCRDRGSMTSIRVEEQGAFRQAPGSSSAENVEHGGVEDVAGQGAVGREQGR
ncbi:hypothetical protein DUNSADRAFT_2486 [Dunaliella salina]|uniref:Uncharacterized protein n=1 Tax=Dunaliella salina TaxID=3046 RepID=A0ABQ7FW82_DUNSA|nr:hypothetical protein DUNSADRAFT_2486 [Dunaliella salina]|eukprot:KAF5826639.1 hypothetical protein DUNSADRAFT_2486 [Dunaliella salina]